MPAANLSSSSESRAGAVAVYVLTGAALLALAIWLCRLTRRSRRTDEAYRIVFEDASDAVAITRGDLQLLDVNAGACDLLGYSREQMLRMNVRDLLVPDELVSNPLRLEDVFSGRTVVNERTFRHKDGRTVIIELSVRALRDGRLIAIGRDVTARREAHRKLRESEAVTRSVVYTAVDGIITADERGIVRSFNPSAERMFGYPAEEVIGNSISMLMPSPDRERHDGYVRAYIETGVKRIIGMGREVTAMRKDGSTFPVELAVSEMLMPGERLFTGILHDITGRKAAEEALRQANAKLQTVIETSPLAVYTLDLNGAVLSWNAGAERIFGWTAAEVLGKPLPTVPESERNDLLRSLKTQSGEPAAPIERRRLTKYGTPVHASVWHAPLRDRDGNITGVLAMVADMSERKLLEDQFRQALKMEAIGRLAGGIAHDFNNILTVVTGYGQMVAERGKADPQLAGEANEILKAAEHASALTRQLLVFSRHQVVNPRILDVNAIVNRLENMLRRLIGEDIDLVVAPARDPANVKADAAQIEQVIINLAVNAREAMPGGGRLAIEIAHAELDATYARTHIGVKQGKYVMLAVSDTGKGIEPEIRAHLFEPFFTTKERGRGTGLGLSTVYGIVKQCGGEIWVYSEVGKGTSLKIYLPQATEDAVPQVSLPEPAASLSGAETVLLVEDETGVRRLVREVLRQQGYEVLEAIDVNDAQRLCREHDGPIHLLLTDVVMPVMSGRELADRLAIIRPDLKVLYMSGYTDNIIVHHGVSASDTPFIQKPFSPRSLARKIREILDAG